jgi:acyl carrier protein
MKKDFKENDLKLILSQVFNVAIESINDQSSRHTIEKWDSLHQMHLIVALEEAFNVTFTDEQTMGMITYQVIKMVLAEQGIILQ